MKLKKRLLSGALALTLLAGSFFINSGQASAEDPAPWVPSQADIDFAAAALTAEPNWAFDVTSVGLHNAILAKYDADFGGTGDVDASDDGYISKPEATAWTGVAIQLPNSGIKGTLKGIENFKNPAFVEIDVHSNLLTGNIPSQLGNIPNLLNIFLYDNHLSGNIPSELKNCTKLRILHLAVNDLSGTIPVELGNITTLIFLSLSENQLTGQIPSSLGTLSNLQTLQLQSNQLTGQIPSSLGNLSNLELLQLNDNQLSGEIPASLGDLSKLKNLILTNNELSGELPSSFQNLNLVTNFQISGNSLALNGVEGEDADLVDDVTQERIDSANAELTNYPPNALTLTVWQTKIDNAQSLLDLRTDAEDQVGTLLTLGEDNLATGITQTEIDNAQTAVDLLPDGSTVKADLQAKIDLAQQMLDATAHVDALLTSDGANRAAGTTQADIEAAKTEVTALPDGTLKDELQAKIDMAQKLLDAETQVGNLLVDGKTALASGVTQGIIQAAQTAVTALPDGTTKTALQADIDLAQAMLDAKTHVDALLTADGANLGIGVTQTTIDNAQTEVTALPDGTLKNELQAKIDIAQALLDAAKLVDELLTDDKANLESGVTQGLINQDKVIVNALPDGTTKTALLEDIAIAQQLLDAKTHVDALLTPDGANLGSGVTQGTIDSAQAEVTALPDGTLKGELQAKIDIAQALLDAAKLVDELLTDDKANLESGVTQDTINNAKTSVNALPEGETKDALLADIDLAQKILDAKKGVYDLFDDTGNIKDVVNQDTLNKAKEAVNGLPDGATKNELLALIAEAQKQLNAKNTVDPTPVQPVNRGTSTDMIGNVDTGDDSNIVLYGIGLLLAAAGLSLVIRRIMIKE